MKKFDFGDKATPESKQRLADLLNELQQDMPIKISSRGWAYELESKRFIDKDQLDRAQNLINKCRRQGYLPVDFVEAEDERKFRGIRRPSTGDLSNTLDWMLRDVVGGYTHFECDWWEGEEYYIQCLCEKVDTRNLFEAICDEYRIPIANSKGWSSILQRASFAKRFQQAEDQGLKCVLLYCGDLDPDGLLISEKMIKNLNDIRGIVWADGTTGYDASNLIVDRFALNLDFAEQNNFTFIDNLITGRQNPDGSKRDLADPRHPNHNRKNVQQYLREVGPRKCESNVLITNFDVSEQLMRRTIEKYLGHDALERIENKEEEAKKEYFQHLHELNIVDNIRHIISKNFSGRQELRDYDFFVANLPTEDE